MVKEKKPIAKKKAVAAPKKAVSSATPAIKTFFVFKKMVPMSPQKLRLVARAIKGLSPQTALTQLKLTDTKRTRIMARLIHQLLSDAKSNFNLDPQTVQIKEIHIDEDQKLKRMDKSHSARFQSGVRITRKSKIKIIAQGK